MQCTKCNSENSANAKYCRACGSKLEEIKQVTLGSLVECPKCGHSIESSKKFCPKCGTSRAESEEKEHQSNKADEEQSALFEEVEPLEDERKQKCQLWISKIWDNSQTRLLIIGCGIAVILLVIAAIWHLASPDEKVVNRNAFEPTQQAGTSSTPASVISPIRQVDFANFTYPSGFSDTFRDPHFPKDITVVKSEWQPKNRENGGFSYSVKAPIYAKLIGNDKEQAIILADCFTGNGDTGEIFIYGSSGGKPVLIQRIGSLDYDPERDSYDLPGVSIRSGRLVVTYVAGGSHARPEWRVTRILLWNGRRFIPGQPIRKQFSPLSR